MDFTTLTSAVQRVFVGKQALIEQLCIALLAGGHVLIDDVPGVGKTVLAKAMAVAVGGVFRRIQFTPDMLPSDVTGFSIYDQRHGSFTFRPGPLMANVVLADEINRTIPRTQAALLEAMAEGQLTVEGHTHPLPRPFLVLATQNPIELEGTFPLPEAQLDRFLMRLEIGYPEVAEEMEILSRFQEVDPLTTLTAVTTPEDVVAAQTERARVHVAPAVRGYVVELVRRTRDIEQTSFGASPRASLALVRAAQARAYLQGRSFVTPDDVKVLAVAVLAHRLVLTAKERARGTTSAEVIRRVLEAVAVPQ